MPNKAPLYRLTPGGGYDPYNSAETHLSLVIAAVEAAHRQRALDMLLKRGINRLYGEFVRKHERR